MVKPVAVAALLIAAWWLRYEIRMRHNHCMDVN